MVFPTGTKGPPLVLGVKPGLKEGTFSPGLVLPVGKPGLKGFPNREQKALLHPCVGHTGATETYGALQ